MAIVTIAIDLAESVLAIDGVNETGKAITLRAMVSDARGQQSCSLSRGIVPPLWRDLRDQGSP